MTKIIKVMIKKISLIMIKRIKMMMDDSGEGCNRDFPLATWRLCCHHLWKWGAGVVMRMRMVIMMKLIYIVFFCKFMNFGRKISRLKTYIRYSQTWPPNDRWDGSHGGKSKWPNRDVFLPNYIFPQIWKLTSTYLCEGAFSLKYVTFFCGSVAEKGITMGNIMMTVLMTIKITVILKVDVKILLWSCGVSPEERIMMTNMVMTLLMALMMMILKVDAQILSWRFVFSQICYNLLWGCIFSQICFILLWRFAWEGTRHCCCRQATTHTGENWPAQF